jgi:hypothetical protein
MSRAIKPAPVAAVELKQTRNNKINKPAYLKKDV